MFAKCLGFSLALFCLAMSFAGAAQEEKKKSGTVIGTLKSEKKVNDGKNSVIEVLAPGEEKARAYFVQWDPKIKAPMQSVLAAVRAAKVGDRVELQWVGTNHGPAITAFKVLKKDSGEKK